MMLFFTFFQFMSDLVNLLSGQYSSHKYWPEWLASSKSQSLTAISDLLDIVF